MLHSPTSNDNCFNIVQKLLIYRKGDESEMTFSKKAIESLVKKLKEKREELDSLVAVVSSNGHCPSICVTIPRTLDGRLQVASRKGFPHVIYSRVWRWPDVHKNELKHLPRCQYAFDLKQELICVNPYHYERASPAGIDLTGLSGLSLHPYPVASSNETSNNSPPAIINNKLSPNIQTVVYNNNKSQQQQATSPFTPDDVKPDLFSLNSAGNQQQPLLINTTIANNNTNETYISPSQLQQVNIFNNASAIVIQNQQQTSNSVTPAKSTNGDEDLQHGGMFEDDYLGTSPAKEEYTCIDKGILSERPLPEFWCSITYFELDQKVGEICKVPSDTPCITVDGYTNPSSPDRFCLGLLTNVHRTESIEKARLYIGKGVQLVLRGEGDVWVKCLSDHSIFVQSYYLDREAGRSPGDAVHKIYPAAFIKVFDLNQCRSQMELLVRQARDVARSRAANVSHNYQPPEALGSLAPALSLSATHSIGADELRRLSVLRLSYVKGWGLDYPRPTIKDTPCWIEVQLFRPLQFLDDFLQSMPTSPK